jgi:hypothetical protein
MPKFSFMAASEANRSIPFPIFYWQDKKDVMPAFNTPEWLTGHLVLGLILCFLRMLLFVTTDYVEVDRLAVLRVICDTIHFPFVLQLAFSLNHLGTLTTLQATIINGAPWMAMNVALAVYFWNAHYRPTTMSVVYYADLVYLFGLYLAPAFALLYHVVYVLAK